MVCMHRCQGLECAVIATTKDSMEYMSIQEEDTCIRSCSLGSHKMKTLTIKYSGPEVHSHFPFAVIRVLRFSFAII